MTTWTALTTLPGKDQAQGLGDALEALNPEPTGVGVFEIEDGSGLWEVGGYFIEQPDGIQLDLLAAAHGAKPVLLIEKNNAFRHCECAYVGCIRSRNLSWVHHEH